MQLGLIGLGRMGFNMAQRLISGGHEVVAFDVNLKPVKELEAKGSLGATSLEALVQKLKIPRAIWVMVPAGSAVDETIEQLLPHLSRDDILIDGGNSNYKRSIQRAEKLKENGIHFLDVGTSGGIWGLKMGYCLMIGGEREVYEKLEPIFKTLAAEDGYLYAGASGAGHFVKMVHNGIEYGMMQAYAEGFDILNASEYGFDLAQVARLWNHGGVVRSWLLELAANAFEKDPKLDSIRGYVEDSGEGRWTVFEAIDRNLPAPIITLSLMARFYSRLEESFGAKVLAALRQEFGGHTVKSK